MHLHIKSVNLVVKYFNLEFMMYILRKDNHEMMIDFTRKYLILLLGSGRYNTLTDSSKTIRNFCQALGHHFFVLENQIMSQILNWGS